MNNFTARLEEVVSVMQIELSGLSDEQFNWKPSAESWSMAQCILHIVKTNKAYFPLYERMAGGHYEQNFWEKRGWFNNFWSNFFVNGVDPKNIKKLKAPASIKPAQSHIEKSIIEKLEEQNIKIGEYYRQLEPKGLDNIIVSSPFAKFVVYPASSTFKIIVLHEERHLQQALRVKNHPGFPK